MLWFYSSTSIVFHVAHISFPKREVAKKKHLKNNILCICALTCSRRVWHFQRHSLYIFIFNFISKYCMCCSQKIYSKSAVASMYFDFSWSFMKVSTSRSNSFWLLTDCTTDLSDDVWNKSKVFLKLLWIIPRLVFKLDRKPKIRN